MMLKKTISIITPVLNEEENIFNFYKRMNAVVEKLNMYDFEFIFTDNASDDSSFDLLTELAAKDSRIQVYRFSRNFGYQASIYTGYQKSSGDAVIEYDCDLQDPPELLPNFIKKWEEGYAIVYGIRQTRKENFALTFLRKVFYRLLYKISQIDLPVDVGDFMLLDKKIVDQLKKSNDKNLYLRGMVFSYGYLSCGIPYDRDSRLAGETKFSLSKMVKLALDGIVNQSTFPLRLSSYVSIFIAFFTFILSGVYLSIKIINGPNIPDGFTTLALLILFGMTLNAFFLGIIGEYLIRIYEQVRNKPHVIIEKSIVVDDKKSKK